MRIACQKRRVQAEQPGVALLGLQPGVEGLGVLHVADMLRDERFGALRSLAHVRECVLLLGAHRQQRLAAQVAALLHCDGGGCETARAADHLDGIARRARLDDARHRIIVARQDGPVVAQKRIGDAGEARVGFPVIGDDGLVMDVSRGHHEHRRKRPRLGGSVRARSARRGGFGEIMHQKMLHGRAGKHHAQLGQLVREPGRQRGAGTFAQQHDRALGALQQTLLRVVDQANPPRIIRGPHHHRERLALAVLALAKALHRPGVGSVARQVEAAQALHRDDASREQQLDGPGEDRVALLPRAAPCDRIVALLPRDPRPAREAGVGLRMEAAVGGVGVLRRAVGAHLEALHRGRGAVVGKLVDDGEARSAVGAVDERIAVTPIGGVEQLAHAIVARGEIG